MHENLLRAACAALSLEEKVLLLTGRDSWSTQPIERIGLRSMVLSDGPAGVRGAVWDERYPSVNFPSPTSLAASWDRTNVRLVGNALGSEAVRKGVDVVLAPTINLQRTPYGGRHFEAFSEDPLLSSSLATEYVAGIQEFGVGATVKHYVANDSETDRFTVDVRVTERVLREVYLQAFEGPIINGGAWLVMSAYNSVNGARATESSLLETPLKSEWNFDGVVVSDWTAVRSVASAKYGQDLVMPGPGGPWGAALVAAVQAGDVAEELIDDKVLRLLRLASRVGALGGRSAPVFRASGLDAADVARSAAAAGTVLLRNNGLLPLESPASVAVIGEAAVRTRTQGGGSATVLPTAVVSPLDGITDRWPEAQVSWSLGAVVEQGLADLPAGSFTSPAGEDGMLIRYIDGEGRMMAEEVRRTSGIVSFDAAALASKSATVEMHLRYRPEGRGATFPFGVAGLCDFEITIDGAMAAQGRLRTGPDDDPAAVVLHPPATNFLLPRSADAVSMVVRLHPVEGAIPDALALRLGVPPLQDEPGSLIDEAVAAAAAAEVAVVVVSTSPGVESEGFDRSSLQLPGHQDELVRAVVSANPNTVVVINSGSPVLAPWIDNAAAAMAVWFPGQAAGTALAQVLAGDLEPGGRLPVSWPLDEQSIPVHEVKPTDGRLSYTEGLHIGHRAWRRAGGDPAFSFGHGLGYTVWELGDVTARRVNTEICVDFCLRNTGNRPGKAVVQLYAERVSPSAVERPVFWLVGFQSYELEPGGNIYDSVAVPIRSLAHWAKGGWAVEAGEYRIVAAFSSDDERGAALLTLDDIEPGNC